MKRKLPFTPRPQAGESPLSVLRRGAVGNHHRSTVRFAFSVNPDLDHSASALGTVARDPDLQDETFAGMGLTPEEGDTVTYRRAGRAREDDVLWNGLRVPLGDLQFRTSKICVACYCENGFASSQWDHVAAVACAKHLVLLDQACPCCGTLWTPDTDPLACGCDANEMAARQERCGREVASVLDRIIRNADQAALRILSCVWSMLQYWSSVGLSLSKATAANALWNMASGRWPVIGQRTASAHSVLLHPRVALAPLLADPSSVCATAAQTLLRQPGPDLLAETLQGVRWPATTVMAVLGTKRVPFEKLVSAGHIAAREDGRYPALDINALLWRLKGFRDADEPMQPLAAHRGGAAPESLASLIAKIRSGAITSYYCPVESGLNGLMCVSPVATATSPTVFGLKDAAQRLGTNTESVRSVIRLGWLKGTKGTPRSAVEWSIEGESLRSFEERYVFASAVAKQHGGSVQTIASRLRSAGLIPVSGPDVDGGVTYLFERIQLSLIDVPAILTGPYRSPAGRKKNGSTVYNGGLLSSREAGAILGISVRDLREAVRPGWITPVAVIARRRMFEESVVLELKRALEDDYVTIERAARDMAQTVPQFRRTWVDSQTVVAHRFVRQTLIAKDDLDRIRKMWREVGTASSIGDTLNRPRWLCPNLETMDQVTKPIIIGHGTSKVRLYSRAEPALEKYKMT